MNEWPDELWENERSRMWATLGLSANDAAEETDPCLSTIGSNGLREARGVLLTWCFFAATELLAATAGWSIIRMLLRRRAFGVGRGRRHTG